MPDSSRCPVCNERKPRNWRLCRECLELYGTDASEWDDWIRFKVNDARRWFYEDRRVYNNEVPLGDFEPYDGMDPDLDEQLWTRPLSEMGASFGEDGPLALPYAPYEDEEMNRQYRDANGIGAIPSDIVW